jgi:hypothetical protein
MAARLITRDDLLKRIASSFERHGTGYADTKRAYNAQCGELQRQIKTRQDQGSSMACSQQQLSEAVWLVHYTDDWKRVDEQLARVKAGIDSPCLTHTIAGGVFTDNTIETYYYGVRFFDTLGYWRRDKRFWLVGEPPGTPSPYELCRSLQAGFARIRDKSEEAEEVEWILAIAISETARNAPSAPAGAARQEGRQ